MAESHYVGDGYDAKFYVKTIDEQFPSVLFTARVMTPKERAIFVEKIHGKSAEAYYDRTTQELTNRITSWSYDEEICKSRVERLHPHIYARMFSIISGVAASDALPEDEEEEMQTSGELLREQQKN